VTSKPLAEGDLQHVLTHTSELWEQMRGKRMFVTGGTGFLGCWLLESFIWANARLGLEASAVVLTRDANRFRTSAPHLANHPAIRIHPGDVRSFEFPSGEFSHVVHAAAEFGAALSSSDSLRALAVAVDGTHRVMELARRCGATRLLLTSSGAIYGIQPTELTHLPEDYRGAPDPLNSATVYAQGKRMAEHLCSLYFGRYGVGATIARCFAFIGPRLPLDAHFAVGNFIRDGLAGRPVRVNGDGAPIRSYLYSADMAVWLWQILFRGAPGRAYNVGSEQFLTVGALAENVASRMGVGMQIAKNPVTGQTADRYVPSTWRAQTELGLMERVGLGDAIDRTVAWHRATV
jgi:nucleoside-diphosphate-sugar epimerase